MSSSRRAAERAQRGLHGGAASRTHTAQRAASGQAAAAALCGTIHHQGQPHVAADVHVVLGVGVCELELRDDGDGPH